MKNREADSQPTFDVPVVAIGASAGGLDALKSFFGAMKSDCGMAFVVVTHRSPDGVNLLPEILAKYTTMPVSEAVDRTTVKPGHVYVSPASHYLRLFDGIIVYNEIVKDHVALPIDYFFRSVADQRKEKAICILLSGGGSDGTIGLQAIKGDGGMAMAQDMRSAQFSDMPGSAIATGLVDYILPPEEMPAALVQYVQGIEQKLQKSTSQAIPEEAMDEILGLIRRQTGSDFGLYKTNTLGRRIERRMNVHHLTDAWDYVRYLNDNAHEIALLFKELLIGVTAFFRDEMAFSVLEQEALPELLKNKKSGDTVRIWVTGCSTGEEPYSFAMLLQEYMEKHSKQLIVQIFATDLDENAINIARAGLYSDGIGLDVSEERLDRHFMREDHHYRVRKNIREMVIFATQNVIQDPPFTKLDLISCRNLLIYLDMATQKKIIPMFHYALRQGGMLFLGSSETVGTFSDIFTPLHARWKIFIRKETPLSTRRLTRIMDLARPHDIESPAHVSTKLEREKVPSITELAQKLLLAEHIPPSLIVNDKGDIFFIHGRTGPYLEPPQGQPQASQNAFDMAREGLQLPLIAVIRKAATQDHEVMHHGIRIQNGKFVSTLSIRARKVTEPEALRGLIWVTFENDELSPVLQEEVPKPSENEQLERELRFVKQSLQSTIEEFETANEQLKSINEELQSTNEELQSANEELETAKEEMQSLNEELQTVNEELENKVQDLSYANDDMKNLLNNTGIATLFLDNDLKIKRFTSQARKIIHLIPADAGRPIRDIVLQLDYNTLEADANEVLQTLIYKEIEVRARDWSWYLMRIMPYRTAENVIDGLVITFVDITRLKKTEILLAANIKALSMMAVDKAEPRAVLDEILMTIERQTPGIWCSLSLLKDRELHHFAAPTLPEAFNVLLDGIDVAPDAPAPCAQAAYLNKHVIEEDVTKIKQTSFTELAQKYNIRAAWSQPVYNGNQDIVGVFTIYYHHAHVPTDMEEDLVNQAVPLMGVALSRANGRG